MKSLTANHKSQITKRYPALTRILFYIPGVSAFPAPKWLFSTLFPIKFPVHAPPPPHFLTQAFSQPSFTKLTVFSAHTSPHQAPCSLTLLGPRCHPLSCSQGPGSHHSPNSSRLFLPASKHAVICPMKNKIKTPQMTPEYFSNSPPVSLLPFKAKYFEDSGYNHRISTTSPQHTPCSSRPQHRTKTPS